LVDEEWKRRYQLISASERRMFERQQARQLHLELDRCHGSCLLRMAETRALVESALRFFDGRRCGCGDFTIMPNHVHWLVQPYAEYDLEQLLQSIKRYSATRVARDVRKAGKFWQKENYDRIVRDRRVLNAFRRYIADNPKNAGLADGEYSFFQAEWSEA
jgi:REP element-mobilizing transposase RayT